MQISITPIVLALSFAFTSVIAYPNWHPDVNPNPTNDISAFAGLRRDITLESDAVHQWYRRGPYGGNIGPSGSVNNGNVNQQNYGAGQRAAVIEMPQSPSLAAAQRPRKMSVSGTNVRRPGPGQVQGMGTQGMGTQGSYGRRM